MAMEEELPLATFHLASDLHLEFGKPFEMPKPEGDHGLQVALLAGDLGHPTKPEYKDLLTATKSKFDHVIVVAGNHEYYAKKKGSHHASVDEVLACARQVAQETGCVFLERESYTLPLEEKVTVLGCTLWSHLEPYEYYQAKQGLNDFRMVYFGKGDFLTPAAYASWHKRDVEWLNQEIDARSDENLVVMTHHVPTKQVIDPVYHGHPLNMCFVTDLEHLFKPHVKLWACGHSHKRGTAQVNSGWCGLNPRGYPGENRGFSPLRFSLFKGGRMKLIM